MFVRQVNLEMLEKKRWKIHQFHEEDPKISTTSHSTFQTNQETSSRLNTNVIENSSKQNVQVVRNPSFTPDKCTDQQSIGIFCNISMKPCALNGICLNDGSCQANPTVFEEYACKCLPGYTGRHCETDIRPCARNPCFYDGIQNWIDVPYGFLILLLGTCSPLDEINSNDFVCNCPKGRTGKFCETLIDHCVNVTCFNNGQCQSVSDDYICRCLSDSYSGRHCEQVAANIKIRQYAAKSISYISIIAMSCVLLFVVTMDVLKYVFGIDPIKQEREAMKREKSFHNQRRTNLKHRR